MMNLPDTKKLILFDGVCNLCNNFIQKVIKNDQKNIFLFASIQSEKGQKIIQKLKIDTQKTDSIILVDFEGNFKIKSNAGLQIIINFGGFWKLVKIGYIFPRFFRDFLYEIIAKNRYQWFGKKNQCMLPSDKIKAKFLN